MDTNAILLEFTRSESVLREAHALFVRRIGADMVEDEASFLLSAGVDTPDWIPALSIARIDGEMAGALLGGLLPGVSMLSLPYTAVDERFEGRGVYTTMKPALIDELRAMARARGLPVPIANVSEETPDSDHFRHKVVRGNAVVLPLAYAQPAVQGLEECPLALTYEPLTPAMPTLTPDGCKAIVRAVFRGLYRIPNPDDHPTFRRIIASIAAPSGPPRNSATERAPTR
jgi:hypothetical protein